VPPGASCRPLAQRLPVRIAGFGGRSAHPSELSGIGFLAVGSSSASAMTSGDLGIFNLFRNELARRPRAAGTTSFPKARMGEH